MEHELSKQVDDQEPAANWWDRHMVPRLIGCACSQGQIMKLRSRIVPEAYGDVLELGCGGGINIDFYDWSRISRFTGIDPSEELLALSRDAVARANLAARGVEARVMIGRGEALPFADHSFDSIVITFTLCSVQYPASVLAEMRRVLKPGGLILFLEHGAAPDAAPARWQRRIEPIWRRLAGNCHLTRPISTAYAAAGFHIEPRGALYMPKTPRPFGWVEYGRARVIG